MFKPEEESPFHCVASTSRKFLEVEKPSLPSDETWTVTLLSGEWKSSKGGLSTINRELAIQLAKHPNVEVYVYLPKCSEEDKEVARSHGVQLIEADELPGYEPGDWLTSLPKGHLPHCLIGHGLHFGRQIPLIKQHHDCKWIQVVHTAPEELGMYKSYEEAILKGEQKHQEEVKLCERADQVVAVGPKLKDAYSRYLRFSGKDQDVINLTPSIFTEFHSIQQASEERNTFFVLVFGRGDGEDFKLKGYDIAVQAVAELKDQSYQLMFVGAPAGKEDDVAAKLLQHGIPRSQLTVRRFKESREELARLFCEVDLAIMPSRTEGFGLTALEALSAGLPVLVSGNSGLGDALKGVSSGFSHVVDSEDPKEWAKAINIVRQKSREVRLEDAKYLREKYAVKYSWQKQCDYLVRKIVHLSFENLKQTIERMGDQAKNVSKKVDYLRESRQGEGKTRNDLQQMKSEMTNISEKLDTLVAQRKTEDEENRRDNLEQMKKEIADIEEKVDTLMNLLPVEAKKRRMEGYAEAAKNNLSGDTEARGNNLTGDCSHEDITNGASQQFHSNVSVEIASCESDITFFAKRYDSDTRQWFFDDFDEWFRDPGDSRAYVLLGDPGVGKSVMAGVMAQRMRKAGHLGAAYFCRHNDSTRNNPRYLLATVARQLCDCNVQYKVIVGGESGAKMLLGNSKLGIRELFTKLLQEPLSKCSPYDQRRLVIIDALDETEYESREDFLDLIMHCFPLLPEWLVFFITSRPEDSVQFRLKKYNPCVKICAGDSDQDNFYQQHEQDIQTFLKKGIDFYRLSVTAEDISKKCNGLFLYAHYIVEELKNSAHSGKKLNQLSDLFPGDIDSFFQQNVKRIYNQVGQDIFKKFFGCAIVAPSPLPVSIISYILKRENANHDEQRVIDAVSQFVVLRTSDQTLAFLHNLIPAWLTDKNKASRRLFIDKKISGEYLTTIFVEILSSFVNESRPTCLLTDADLQDYVSRVAVRFLCQKGAKDSLKAVFDCLTSYQFIERRIQSGRIEIYHLLDDLSLAASCLSVEEVSKHEILEEMLFVLGNNVIVLLECPHLLHSCLRNASNAVRETVLIPRVSAPWLELIVYAFLGANIADMDCFATSPDGRTVAGAKGRSLQFFDPSTVENVSDPFDLSIDTIDTINHLEYSPDGKFLFFGRLDNWFSVERGCVEEFPQFLGNSHVYKWGVLTRDGQCIVVNRSSQSSPIACEGQSCVFNLLALWAMKEIEQSGDDELTVRFCPHGLEQPETAEMQIKRFFACLVLRGMLGEGDVRDNHSCYYCRRLRELTESNPEPSLVTIRQLVIQFYPCIFNYQVWDLETGTPLLQQVFSGDIELNPFTYFCHVVCAFSDGGSQMDWSGIWNATSCCNIATVSACCSVLSRSYVRYARRLDYILETIISSWNWMHEHELGMTPREVTRKLKQLFERVDNRMQPFTVASLILVTFEKKPLLDLKESSFEVQEIHKFGISLKRKHTIWQRVATDQLFWEVHNDAVKTAFWRNIPNGFQDLLNCVDEILVCASPESKWVIQTDRSRKVSLLHTGIQEQQYSHREYFLIKFMRFTFTNDHLYLVYSCEGSLHALSLSTGTVLTNVSGCNLYYFTEERQFGYLFRYGTQETAIFLTSLFSPFKFLTASPSVLGKSVAAILRSSNAVMSVSSDAVVTLWQTPTCVHREVIACVSESSLTTSSPQPFPVKNCVLSSDGSLIAIHREIKVELYSFANSELKLLHSVFESTYEFTVTYFAFSADSFVLLFCIQDSRNDPYFYTWDIKVGVILASFKSPGFLTVECCYISWDNRELVLCGDYEIEIWEYAEHARSPLTRLAVKKPYNSVRFSQCTMSEDKQFLVCCIADVILVYSLNAPNISFSQQVIRGHLGKIEFCRFLKKNRYLISYGVDGMVFLWGISESKAVGFARITEGQESIVSMAVSPEEDRAVCITSSGRMCMIKLCSLGAALPLKAWTSPSKGKVKTAETSLQLQEQIASASQISTSSIEDDMFEPMSGSDFEDVDFSDLQSD